VVDAAAGTFSIVHTDQRDGADPSAFVGDSVALLDVRFRVVAAGSGDFAGVLQIGSASVPLSIISTTSGGADVSDSQGVAQAREGSGHTTRRGRGGVDSRAIQPTCASLSAAAAQMNDHRDGAGARHSSLSLQVRTVQEVGLYAYAAAAELFNSAPLDGSAVTTAISAFVVHDWSGQAGARLPASLLHLVALTETGSISPPTDPSRADTPPALACSVRPADGAVLQVAASGATCVVTLRPSATRGAAAAPVTLTHGAFSAAIRLRVWYPAAVYVAAPTLIADAPTLRRVVAESALAPSCAADRYQSAPLLAYADISAGKLQTFDVDVTHLVAFESASVAVRVTGPAVRGLQATPQAAIDIARHAAPSALAVTPLLIAVSDDMVRGVMG